MKKTAKSRASKLKKTAVVQDGHLGLAVDNDKRIQDLSQANQALYQALSGSIRQLMSAHNALLESAKGLTAANARTIAAAAAVIECSVDQKIDHMNEFLDRESESGQNEPKSNTRSIAMRRAWAKRKKTSKAKIKKTPKKNVKK